MSSPGDRTRCEPLRCFGIGRVQLRGALCEKHQLIGAVFRFVRQNTSANTTGESIHAVVDPKAWTQSKLLLEAWTLAGSIWCAGSCKSQTPCKVRGQLAGGRGSGPRRH